MDRLARFKLSWATLVLALGCAADPAVAESDAGSKSGSEGGSEGGNVGGSLDVSSGADDGTSSDLGTPEDATSGSSGDPEQDPETTGNDPECALEVEPLFRASEVLPIVTEEADGVILTRGAGRVRGRHELEEHFNPFAPRYFEHRSYGFELRDAVAAGESRIEITYRPETTPTTYGPTTNFRAWKIYGNGNVFHDNTSLERVGDREWTKVIETNAREGRPLQVGDVMEFEFGIFIAGNDAADPDGIEGQTAYYTDTFRYRVGHGGLQPRNDDPSGALGPMPNAILAGDITIPYIQTASERPWMFSQMALNMQPEHVQPFLEGRRLFHTDFETGDHTEPGNPSFDDHAGLLGPTFNASSCAECHVHNGRGRVPEPGEPLLTTAIKLYDHDAWGDQLQPQEHTLTLETYDVQDVVLADGSTVELRRPIYSTFDGAFSPRLPRQLPGLGLLEAIDEADILAYASCDPLADGISGRALIVSDPRDGAPRLGRFGWKAEKASLEHQVADALIQDMGVSTDVFPDDDGTVELDTDALDRLTAYVRLLALPGREHPDDPSVVRGQAVFAATGCILCHRPELVTGSTHPNVELRAQTIRPYTDLLLHDLGDGLADPQGGPLASEWRTPPLWGVGRLIDVQDGEVRLLHDGRARSFLEAILWHGGEATFARDAVQRMPTDDREALLAFLASL